MPARTALKPIGGVPVNECLVNWQPEELVEDALCWVYSTGNLYKFEKSSMAVEIEGDTIATCKGPLVPGRWIACAGINAKAYISLSYAYPNSDSPTSVISCLPQLTDTWTPFQTDRTALPILVNAQNDALYWDNDKGIVTRRPMNVEISWHMSWCAHSNYLWDGAVMLNGAVNPIAGSISRGYYNSTVTDNHNEVMSACCLATLGTNNTLELMVRTTGQLSNTDLVASFCVLNVREI